MPICWERAVPLAFHLCSFYFSAVLIVGIPFPFRFLGQDMEFDCIEDAYSRNVRASGTLKFGYEGVFKMFFLIYGI